ncbi:MAG: M20/M25/M40 family metallo-hydrolase [Myxococcales bacterium]|nr:M20/M25/M40 family metallo-hydrolase [Myxococcales bacterium]
MKRDVQSPSISRWGLALGICALAACGAETESKDKGCDPASPASAAACVDADKYLTDLKELAKTRSPGSDAHAAVRAMLVKRLKELKYEVTEQPYGIGTNVIGEIKGSSKPDEIVMIGAHYDSTFGCTGADDNATGVAGALQAAEALAKFTHERTIQIAFWDEEERGLIGSGQQAAKLAQGDRKVVTVFDFEMIGFTSDEPNSQELPAGFDILFAAVGKYWNGNDRRGDFIAVIHDENSKKAAEDMVTASAKHGLTVLTVELTQPFMQSANFGDLRRSDHASFWTHGYPGMMITDTANFRNTHYHCTNGEDTIDRLNHAFTVGVVQSTVDSAMTALKADGSTAFVANRGECDLDKQDCKAGQKCTMTAPEKRILASCQPVSDTPAGLGEACSRPNNKFGDDNCDKGLICTPFGQPTTGASDRRCRKACSKDATCGSDERCILLMRTAYTSSLHPSHLGACVKLCDPFEAGKCGAGLMCANGRISTDSLKEQYVCNRAGKAAVGKACSASATAGCVEGADCVYGPQGALPTCKTRCDAKHPCATGTCTPYPFAEVAGMGHCTK